ncbi:MAG: acetyltransferase [Desulfitobacterium hafniense]|nr:acetyltransferase [Desulfitobacterium hafniense]
MKYSVIILGAGGHAKVLQDALRLNGIELIGFTTPDLDKHLVNNGTSRIGNDDTVFNYDVEQIRLINGLGSIRSTSNRRRLFNYFKNRGYLFYNVIHPSSIVASDVLMGEGVQIMAGVIVQSGTKIGKNTIVNTRVSVDHDCDIGSHVHVAPGAILSGGVEVGEGVHIGTGAIIIQGIKIGRNSIIGAGSVVVRDVPEETISIGVPARVVKK